VTCIKSAIGAEGAEKGRSWKEESPEKGNRFLVPERERVKVEAKGEKGESQGGGTKSINIEKGPQLEGENKGMEGRREYAISGSL